MNDRLRTWVLIAAFVGTLGCGQPPDGTTTSRTTGTVRFLVAASTQEAARAVTDAFTQESGVAVTLQADSSSKLALQLAHGAPGDLFLSANEEWVAFLGDKELVAAQRMLLGNRLVLVAPRGNPGRVARPQDLADPAVAHLALAGPTVPAGQYARQALRKLNLWEQLEKKVVSADDVRAALAYVERGEAEAGVVYATDARLTDRVEVVCALDPATHAPIRYPLVLLKAGQDNVAARQFYAYLSSPAATAVFQRFGFTALGED